MALASMAALPAQGQRRGGGGRGGDFGRDEPNWWGSFAIGYQWSNAVNDPKTDALWNFDANWSMRASVERAVAPRTAVGLVWKYARMPLTITSTGASGTCRPCGAEATIASYGLTARSGGGRGLHLVYEGFLGATQYNNFTLNPTSSAAATSSFSNVRNVDFAWAVATGAGYAISNEVHIVAMYEYGNSIHEKAQVSLFQRRTTQHYTTRLGLRLGL